MLDEFNEKQLVLISNFENKVSSHAPYFYLLVYTIILTLYIVSADLLFSKQHFPNLTPSTLPPFHLLCYTLMVSLVTTFTVCRRTETEIQVSFEIHAVCFALSLFVICLLLAHQWGHLPQAFVQLSFAWILMMLYETQIQGERYARSQFMALLGMQIGFVLCVFRFQFDWATELITNLGMALLGFAVYHTKRQRASNPFVIANTYLIHQLTVLGLVYPVQMFGSPSIAMLLFSTIFGVLGAFCLIILFRGFQTGQPSVMINLVFFTGVAGAVLELSYGFEVIRLGGIVVTLAFFIYMFIDHKNYIEVGGFNIEEPESNPFMELKQILTKSQ